jgi:hypothetical protein
MAVTFENLAKHVSAMCGQNAEFVDVKPGGTYSNYLALKGLNVHGRKHRINNEFAGYLKSSVSNMCTN